MARRNNLYTIYIDKKRVFYGVNCAEFIKSLCAIKDIDMIVKITTF